MSQPGIGVMLGHLSGNEETVAAYHAAIGRKIAAARLDEVVREDGAVVLDFVGGGNLILWDGGRSCCESRYITTDDDLADLVGKCLHSIEIEDGQEAEGDYDVHETAFVKIAADDGTRITLTTHNEHNGYYGGFWLQLAVRDLPQTPPVASSPSGLTQPPSVSDANGRNGEQAK